MDDDDLPALDPGDVVSITAGGPAMTVTELTPAGQVQCVWFNRHWNRHTGWFDRSSLKILDGWLERDEDDEHDDERGF